jgi:hypothetical protein
MVRTTLVKEWIEAGKRLTEALDKAKLEVVASLWFYDAGSDQWRLMIASPLVDQRGPLEAYRMIQKVLADLGLEDLRLSDISAVSPDHDLIKLLRVALQTGKGISGIRFTRNRINDQFIEDAYIYRLA